MPGPDAQTASPIIVLDELDKAFHIRGEADPLAPLHALLEPENSSAFRDEYLELPLACDAVIWIFTANDIVGIAPSILDRLLVLDIDLPTQSQMRQVQASLYRDVASAYGEWFQKGFGTSNHGSLVRNFTSPGQAHPRVVGQFEIWRYCRIIPPPMMARIKLPYPWGGGVALRGPLA